MIYILIVLWGSGLSTGSSGKTSLAAEFNDLASCRAAAAEIKRQKVLGNSVDVILCAQKGKP